MSRFRPLSTSGEVSLFPSSRLPGELTGSGSTCPTPAPQPLPAALQGIHPRLRWFPGSVLTIPPTGLDSARYPRESGLIHIPEYRRRH